MQYSRVLFSLPLLVGVAGCSLGSRLDKAVGLAPSDPVVQTAGAAVGDEPFAVTAATAILSQGGSAADAVTAMFFAMSATYPVAAGLGGGGICLVAPARGPIQEFDFLPHAAAAGGAVGVPGAVSGFHALQAAFGALPWQRDVSPGETYAATGFPISHALSLRLDEARAVLTADPALRAEFLDANGAPLPEGTVVKDSDLAQTLAAVRLSGVDGFYHGAVAAAITGSTALTPADMSGYRSAQTTARQVAKGNLSMALPGPGTGAGAFAAALSAAVPASANPEPGVVAAVRQALAKFNITTVPRDLGATGFAAVDAHGQAAACAVTMNGPFGVGYSAGHSGITLAASPDGPRGMSSAFLTPLIARDSDGAVALAGAGAGGPNGTAAIIYALLKLAGGQQLGRRSDLRSTGAAPFATVNAISCSGGVCIPLPDPGGHGLGAAADVAAPAR